jgi:hypothetical protein
MENEVRLVDANTLPIKFDGHTFSVWKCDLDAAPTVDAVPVVHSRWKFNADGSGTCENCHFTQRGVWDYDNHQHYCGVCGARMDLEEQK